MAYEIRTLSIGGILDSTLRLFRDHFKFIIVVTGLVYLPCAFGLELWQASLTPTEYVLTSVEDAGQSSTVPMAKTVEALNKVVTFLLGALLQGAVVYGIAMRIRGNAVLPGEAIRHALRLLVGLVGLSLLYLLGVLAGFVLLIVPGIIFALMWYVIVPVYVLENLPAGACFARSAQIMKGHKGKAFVAGFLINIVFLGTMFFLAILLPNAYAVAALVSVFSGLLVATNAIALTVIYFSGRCANENLDLELAAESMEEQVPQENASQL